MAEEGHLPPRDTGRTKTSAPMEHGAPSKILPVEIMDDDFPLFPNLFNFTATSFLFRQVLLQYFYCLFKPNRASTFLQTRALIF